MDASCVNVQPAAAVVEDSEDKEITLEQFKANLAAIDKTLRALPATAQVANQQGRYLAELFRRYHVQPGPMPEDAPAFKYKHLGSFAYVGADKAVMEVAVSGEKPGVLTGWLMGWAWKGIESWNANQPEEQVPGVEGLVRAQCACDGVH